MLRINSVDNQSEDMWMMIKFNLSVYLYFDEN